jgi:hypothetical protein
LNGCDSAEVSSYIRYCISPYRAGLSFTCMGGPSRSLHQKSAKNVLNVIFFCVRYFFAIFLYASAEKLQCAAKKVLQHFEHAM